MAQLTTRQFAHSVGRTVDQVENTSFVFTPPCFRDESLTARSELPTIAGVATTADTAYAVYVGTTQRKITAQKVLFTVSTAGDGAQVAEVGLFSSPAAPNGAAQTLTKIVADGTLDDLTGTGVKGNTTAFDQDIDAGTHLWAVFRANMATTEPTVYGLTADQSRGRVLALASASALTGVTTVAGALITAALTWQAPALEVSYT